MDTKLERKFLHDIASPLSVSRLTIGLILEELSEEPPSPFHEKLKKKLDRIHSSIQQMEELHAQHKENISKLE